MIPNRVTVLELRFGCDASPLPDGISGRFDLERVANNFEPRTIEVTGQPPDYAAAFEQMADVPGEPIVIPSGPIFLRARSPLLRERVRKLSHHHGRNRATVCDISL
jgi:hypothetical protein